MVVDEVEWRLTDIHQHYFGPDDVFTINHAWMRFMRMKCAAVVYEFHLNARALTFECGNADRL